MGLIYDMCRNRGSDGAGPRDPLYGKLSDKKYRQQLLAFEVEDNVRKSQNRRTFFYGLALMAAVCSIPLFVGNLPSDDLVTKEMGAVVGSLAVAWFAYMIPRYWGGMKP